MTLARGAIWYAELPRVGDKLILVVSPDFINIALGTGIVARITSVERDRQLPTFVELQPGEAGSLPDRSFVICHDLFTLPQRVFRRHVGTLSPYRMLEVEWGLRTALGM